MKYSKSKCDNYGDTCYGLALEGDYLCKKCNMESAGAEDYGVYHE